MQPPDWFWVAVCLLFLLYVVLKFLGPVISLLLIVGYLWENRNA